MKERFHDPRLQVWPPIYQDGEALELRARILSPMRFTLVKYWFFLPLIDIWKIALLVLIVDGLGTWARAWTLFHYTEAERIPTYGVMAALWVLWHVEQLSGYRITRFFMGKTLRIRVSPDGVWAGCRRRKMRKLPFEYGISFAVRQLASGDSDDVFDQSRAVTCIIGDSSRHDLAEVISENKAEMIVANANFILGFASVFEEPGVDIDPSRLAG